MLASFSSLPSIFGYLVLRKRDEKHNCTRHHEKNLYLRTGVHSDSKGLVSIWSLRSLRKKCSAIAAIIAIIWKPLSSDRSDNDRWDTKRSITAIAGEVSIWSQRSHSDHMETRLYIGQARALSYKEFLDILLLTVLHVLSIQTEWKPQLPPLLKNVDFRLILLWVSRLDFHAGCKYRTFYIERPSLKYKKQKFVQYV